MSPSKKLRLYADFQKLEDRGRAILVCRGTFEDLAKLGIVLEEGLEVVLYSDDLDEHGRSDDLEVDAVVALDEDYGHWVASFDPRSFRHASER